MKTGIELLGRDWCGCEDKLCAHDLDLVAERAREEMREEAGRTAIDAAVDGLFDESASKALNRIVVAIKAISVKS